MKPILAMTLLPTAISNMLNTPKPTLNPLNPQPIMAETQSLQYIDIEMEYLIDNDVADGTISSGERTITASNEIFTITYTIIDQLYEVYPDEDSPTDLYYNKNYIYCYMTITPYIRNTINAMEYTTYNNEYISWYIGAKKEVPKYQVADSVANYDPNQTPNSYTDTLVYTLPQSTQTNILILIDFNQPNNPLDYQLNPPYTRTLRVFYNQDENIVINNDIIDLPGLLWEIIAMPFAFITQAFDLTLFPGTPYTINIANTIMVFLGILILFAILKIVLKIFL